MTIWPPPAAPFTCPLYGPPSHPGGGPYACLSCLWAWTSRAVGVVDAGLRGLPLSGAVSVLPEGMLPHLPFPAVEPPAAGPPHDPLWGGPAPRPLTGVPALARFPASGGWALTDAMEPSVMAKKIRPVSIPSVPRTAVDGAHEAERMRSQLADFWGKLRRGSLYGADLLRTMYVTVTGQVLTPGAAAFYLDLCASYAAAYRASDVWVAPAGMGGRIAAHPFLNGEMEINGNLEDGAPARDGLVYFPTPIHLDDLHPMYGLAWHMTGSGDGLIVDVETITSTALIPTRLPPVLAATTPLPRFPYCPNGLATFSDGILNGYGKADLFGAPGPATMLALLLAFWDLRRPATPADTPDGGEAVDEDVVSVVQHSTAGSTKPTARGRKNKRNQRPRKRKIRIIREPVHTKAAEDRDRPADDATRLKWKDDTLRWGVSGKRRYRCPNPHQHRAIIEAGGECKPVLVWVKEHTNGPKGRPVDPRRAVRIIPERP